MKPFFGLFTTTYQAVNVIRYHVEKLEFKTGLMGKAVPLFLIAATGATMVALLQDRHKGEFAPIDSQSWSLLEFEEIERNRAVAIARRKRDTQEKRKLSKEKNSQLQSIQGENRVLSI